MAIGRVALTHNELFLKNVSFFVPSAELALSINKAQTSSHVLLEDICQHRFFQDKTCVVDCRDKVNSIADLLLEIKNIATSFVVVVPVAPDWSYWQLLQRFNQEVSYILDPEQECSETWTRRFLTLDYCAVVANANAKCFLSKDPQPPLLAFDEVQLALARDMQVPASQDFYDTVIDPLQPLRDSLDLCIYEVFEADRVKYHRYDEAIELAISDLSSTAIFILIIGPGRGPLIDSVVKHAPKGANIYAVEKNDHCIPLLKEKNRKHWDGVVHILHEDIRFTSLRNQKFDLVVSELIGSFGCNEACPEILTSLKYSPRLMIPQTVTNFIRPIHINGPPCTQRHYLMKSTRSYPLAEMKQVFQWQFPLPQDESLSKSVTLDFTFNFKEESVNALEGFFEAVLYGPIKISILPNLWDHEQCPSWYPMVFPLKNHRSSVSVTISRTSTKDSLWYEWNDGDQHNKDGCQYRISL